MLVSIPQTALGYLVMPTQSNCIYVYLLYGGECFTGNKTLCERIFGRGRTMGMIL